MHNADYWIKKLELQKHPEGGWFKEIYRSDEIIKNEHLHGRYSGDRNISTSIYFLLTSGVFSAFHRIKSDELWHFYTGSPVTIHLINTAGDYSQIKLGSNYEEAELFQCIIPNGTWFGAEVNDKDSFSLIGCTVAPGFNFNDFELGKRNELLKLYPRCEAVINRLTRE